MVHTLHTSTVSPGYHGVARLEVGAFKLRRLDLIDTTLFADAGRADWRGVSVGAEGIVWEGVGRLAVDGGGGKVMTEGWGVISRVSSGSTDDGGNAGNDTGNGNRTELDASGQLKAVVSVEKGAGSGCERWESGIGWEEMLWDKLWEADCEEDWDDWDRLSSCEDAIELWEELGVEGVEGMLNEFRFEGVLELRMLPIFVNSSSISLKLGRFSGGIDQHLRINSFISAHPFAFFFGKGGSLPGRMLMRKRSRISYHLRRISSTQTQHDLNEVNN